MRIFRLIARYFNLILKLLFLMFNQKYTTFYGKKLSFVYVKEV